MHSGILAILSLEIGALPLGVFALPLSVVRAIMVEITGLLRLRDDDTAVILRQDAAAQSHIRRAGAILDAGA